MSERLTIRARMWTYIQAHPGITARELSVALGMTRKCAAVTAHQLELDGRLVSRGLPGRPSRWWIAEDSSIPTDGHLNNPKMGRPRHSEFKVPSCALAECWPGYRR